MTRLGEQTIKLDNPPTITDVASIVGPKEGQGPLAKYFDQCLEDEFWGEKTWEKAESKIIKETVNLAITKSGIPASKIENKENEDFLLQSEFYRVNCNKKTITKISEAYPNYLVLTFNSIKIYRSKEHFLYGRTPLTILPFSALGLCDVINVNETSFKNIKNVFKYNFCIEINKEKIEPQKGDQSVINRKKNEYESNNNMNQKDQKRKPKKMKLIESSKSNKVKGKVDPLSHVNNDDKTILSIISNLPDIITFSSCNQDVVYKWVYSINYLMKEAK